MDHITNILSQHSNLNANIPDPAKDEQPMYQIPRPQQTAELSVKDHEQNPQSLPKPSVSEHKSNDDIRVAVYRIKDQLDAILRLLDSAQPVIPALKKSPTMQVATEVFETTTGDQIIEGVFNGLKMVGPDGKEYDVPPNYASKSKLVEGDMMKLTMTKTGAFIYKQIGPIERTRVKGILLKDTSEQWFVHCDGRNYKILTASVTFFKGKPNDEVILLVPEDGMSEWGAVEHIINK